MTVVEPRRNGGGDDEDTGRPERTSPSHRAQFVWGILALLGLALPILGSGSGPDPLLNLLPRSHAERAEKSFSHARTGAEGPPIVWLRFDEESLRNLAGPDAMSSAPLIPRHAIAELLKRIRTSQSTLPDMVYLDVALAEPGDDPASEERLVQELGAWQAGARAPPLAIFAGRSCTAPRQLVEAGAGDDTIVFFDPGIYGAIATPSPDGERYSDRRIFWSCPNFAGLMQAEYSCVTTKPNLASGKLASKLALPSPAWFADAVRTSPRAPGPALTGKLTGADMICRGVDPERSGLDRPYQSRMSLAYQEDKRFGGLSQRTAGDGRRPLLTVVPVGRLLGQPRSDLSALGGAIVVIGAGNSWFPDIVSTEVGQVPGSLLVGAGLREARIFGLYEPLTAEAYSVLIFCSFVLATALLRCALPRLRRWSMKKIKPRFRLLAFLLLHEQVIVMLLFALLFWMPNLFGIRLTPVLVVVVLLVEALLLSQFLEEEWDREKLAG